MLSEEERIPQSPSIKMRPDDQIAKQLGAMVGYTNINEYLDDMRNLQLEIVFQEKARNRLSKKELPLMLSFLRGYHRLTLLREKQ
jgi:hypothetical protein